MRYFFINVCQFFASHFDYSQPITLSDTISAVAMIAAVVAAIVAIHGNKQSQEATRKAEEQFNKNMQEQKRAINVSLFDLRADILTSIESGKMAFNRTRARMLFNDSIADTIDQYDSARSEEKRFHSLKNEYLDLIRSMRADDTYEEATDLLRQIQDYSCMDPDNPLYEQIRSALRERGYTGKWTHGSVPFEIETVNYVDVNEAEHKFRSMAEHIKEDLMTMVKQFIEASIQ